jgi:cytochrome c556
MNMKNKLQELETRIANLEDKTASTPVRRAAEKVLKAMKEMERELEKMPSFSRGKDPYYADLAERWYLLAMKVEEEVEHIAGAY